MNLLMLFFTFVKIGLFTIGGGYASLPLVEDAVVRSGLITYDEFADMIAIAEMTPGPIGLNVATFIGTKLQGFLGGLIATVGFILPSFIIVLSLALLYYKFKNLRVVDSVLKTLRPAVTGLIGAAGLTIVLLVVYNAQEHLLSFGKLDLFALIGVILCTVLLRIKKLKMSPIAVMITAGIAGGLYYYFA